MATKNEFVSEPVTRDLVITRIFEAPIELVWKAFTEPERSMQWWGPKGFTCPVCKIDFRVGGEYLNCMRSPDGKDFWSKGVYKEIISLKKLVMTDSFADDKGNTVSASHYGMTGDWPLELLVTMTFEEQEGKTKFTLRHSGLPEGEMKEMCGTGWNESFDKLAAFLVSETRSTSDREIVINRLIHASPELVFQAWTIPHHVAKWWGPNGFTNTIHEMDVKPGGVWRFIMHGPDGVDYPNNIVFEEVVINERLAYTHGSDVENDPHQFHVMVTFEKENENTRLTMRSLFNSTAERDKVVKEFKAIEGGNQTLNRLEAYLPKM